MSKRNPQDIVTEHISRFGQEPGFLDLLKESNNDDQYEKFFRKKMKEANIDSLDDLSDEEKKKFFDQVDKDWKTKKEKKQD